MPAPSSGLLASLLPQLACRAATPLQQGRMEASKGAEVPEAFADGAVPWVEERRLQECRCGCAVAHDRRSTQAAARSSQSGQKATT